MNKEKKLENKVLEGKKIFPEDKLHLLPHRARRDPSKNPYNMVFVNNGSKYKHVSKYQTDLGEVYKAKLKKDKENKPWFEYLNNQRKAAVAIDTKLLERGKDPVNILSFKGIRPLN